MNQFPPSPILSHEDRFELFRKFAEIFASQGASVSDTGGKLPPVSEAWGKVIHEKNQKSKNRVTLSIEMYLNQMLKNVMILL
jgi:hypothetical protein